MKSRVHPTYKTKYHVGNWREYERALVHRGDVTVWLSADATADEHPTWGDTRIRGALANLGHHIAPNTVKRILRDPGIAPAPERTQRTPWKTFLQAHGEGLAAVPILGPDHSGFRTRDSPRVSA